MFLGTSNFMQKITPPNLPPPKVQIWIRGWEKMTHLSSTEKRKRRKAGRKEGKKRGGKERRKEGKKEGQKIRKEAKKRNVNVFLGTSNFM